MSEHEFSALRTSALIVAAVIAIGLERLLPHGRLRWSWRANLGLWGIDLVLMTAICGACAVSVASWARGAEVGLLNVLPVPWWAGVAVCVVALDLVSYGWHRANHQVAVLWRFHQVHHSDTAFTVSTALRFHPGELLLALPVRLAAIVALGAPGAAVLAFEGFFALANLVEHGDINLPLRLERALERVCITPALHRWHHSRRWTELNTNFGTIFVVWDRAFGTLRPNSSATAVETGLPGIVEPIGFVRALALPSSGARR